MTQGQPNSGYTPQAGSLAARVISFFDDNPDEELDLDALEAKFDKPRKQWHSILGAAVLGCVLKREELESDGELVYRLGSGNAPATPFASTKKDRRGEPPADDALARGGWLGAKVSQPAGRPKRFVIDLESIKFIEGVPLPNVKTQAGISFAPTLLKMKVGAMFKQPHEAKSALEFAMAKLKKSGGGEWQMRKFPDCLGVWRVK